MDCVDCGEDVVFLIFGFESEGLEFIWWSFESSFVSEFEFDLF